MARGSEPLETGEATMVESNQPLTGTVRLYGLDNLGPNYQGPPHMLYGIKAEIDERGYPYIEASQELVRGNADRTFRLLTAEELETRLSQTRRAAMGSMRMG